MVASDYDDFYIASVDDGKEQIETAEYSLRLVGAYLNEKFVMK